MKRKNQLFLVLFLLIIINIFLVVLLNINYFKEVIQSIVEIYGYPAIFVLAIILDLIEQPIGPEIPAIVGIVLGMNFYLVYLIASMGTILAGLINLYVGKNILRKRIVNSCSVSKHKKYCIFFSKYGKFSLFLASITPIPYVVFVWISGAFLMKTRDFFIFGLIPRLFRLAVILFLASNIVSLF